MNTVLVDTDVVSFLFKGDSRASDYAPLLQGQRLAMSFMTVAELFQWSVVRRWGPDRVADLERALKGYVVVPVDIRLCRIWGSVRGQGEMAGRTIAPQDAWIAATAIRHDLPLITHNPSDYSGIAGLAVRTASA